MGSVGAKQGGGIPNNQPQTEPQVEPQQEGLNHNMKSAEVSQYAKDKLGIEIQEKVVGKIGRHKIINSLQHVEDILNELPNDIKSQLGVNISAEYHNNSAMGAIHSLTGEMYLNTKYWVDKDIYKAYEWDVKNEWHPEGTTAEAIIAHEIGHRLEALFIGKKYGGVKSLGSYLDWAGKDSAKQLIKDAITEAKKVTGIKGGSMANWMNTISGYAASKKNGSYQYHETIAEAVADYAQNKDKAKPLSKEIWKKLKAGLS